MEKCEPLFMHPNIQPFEELTEESIRNDEIMVHSLLQQLDILNHGTAV